MEITTVFLQGTSSRSPYYIQQKLPVRYYCGCTKDKVAGALATISTKDLEEIINDGEEIEVKCWFCNSAYRFGIEELKEIMASRGKSKEAGNEA